MRPGPQDRQERVARNQSLFREVNEQIESLSRGSNLTFHGFCCECADENCNETLSLTIQEYEYIRGISTHFS
jgi:hypothetical protein